MNKANSILCFLILCSILVYWFFTSSVINTIAIILIAGLGVHYFLARGAQGLIFPSLFLILNLYMVLALISEYSEFETWNEAKTMVLCGSFYLGSNIVLSILTILGVIKNGYSTAPEIKPV